MKVMIRVLVYMNRESCPVYERVLVWDNCIKFPFEHTIEVLKCLYGQTSLVVFEI